MSEIVRVLMAIEKGNSGKADKLFAAVYQKLGLFAIRKRAYSSRSLIHDIAD